MRTDRNIREGITAILFAVMTIASVLAVAPVAEGSDGTPSEILIEDFSEPTLDPSWEVVPGLCSYSLTDYPGYLRYFLEGPLAYEGSWRGIERPGWSPSLTLIRPFSGGNWIFTGILIGTRLKETDRKLPPATVMTG